MIGAKTGPEGGEKQLTVGRGKGKLLKSELLRHRLVCFEALPEDRIKTV